MASTVPGTPPSNTRVPHRILVVEDDALQRRALARFLSRWGYEPVEAEDGGVAIEKVDQANRRFALVLVDIMLPVCDGVEVARHVRARWPEQPILACSAAFNDDLVEDLNRLEVRDFLHKPYAAETLRALVEQLSADDGD
jgi:two-component system, cell cycle sensor histidine kinase and response regulator CckA